jgi:hypothetical protein
LHQVAGGPPPLNFVDRRHEDNIVCQVIFGLGFRGQAGIASRKAWERVPCWNETIWNLRTVYVTVRERLDERVRECRIQFHEPASLVGSITVSPYW